MQTNCGPLLHTMGYEEADGVYEHSERQVVFLGDFIDRRAKNSRRASDREGHDWLGSSRCGHGQSRVQRTCFSHCLADHRRHRPAVLQFMPGMPLAPNRDIVLTTKRFGMSLEVMIDHGLTTDWGELCYPPISQSNSPANPSARPPRPK